MLASPSRVPGIARTLARAAPSRSLGMAARTWTPPRPVLAVSWSSVVRTMPARPAVRLGAAVGPAHSRMSSSSTVYQTTSTEKAPKAIGPYSQATIFNGLVFCSGCIPFDPVKMETVEGGIEAQTQRALDNLFAVLEASGSDKSHVLKTTVFLKDMNDFAKVNGIYEAAFAPYKPARSAVEVARLPRDVLVEVEAIAAVKQ